MGWNQVSNLKGPQGDSISIKGTISGTVKLADKQPTAKVGDVWILGSPIPSDSPAGSVVGDGVIWTTTPSPKWVNIGQMRGPQGDQGPGRVIDSLGGATAGSTSDAPSIKAVNSGLSTHDHPISKITDLQGELDKKAPLKDPAFEGTVTLPATGPNDTDAATKKYVDDRMRAIAGGVSLVGTYDASVNPGVVHTAVSTAPGITANQKLPDASEANKGWYLIVVKPGTANDLDFVDNGPMEVGDWVLSDGKPYTPAAGDGWLRIPMSVHGKEVYYEHHSAPLGNPGFLQGQVWIDSDDQQIHVKNTDSSVVPVTAVPISHTHVTTDVEGLSDAIAGATEVSVGTNQPAGSEKLWVHPTDLTLKFKNGTSWSDATLRGTGWFSATGSPKDGANDPVGMKLGDLYLDTTSGEVWRYE